MITFGTAGIRGPVTDVTPGVALRIGRVAGLDVLERRVQTGRDDVEAAFVVARDGRLTGPTLEDAVVAGLQSAGVSVLRAGRLPTPALAYASRGRYGVALTASHNPPPDNGIKLFRDGVEYSRDAEDRIEQGLRTDPDPAPWDSWTESSSIEPLDRYRDAVVEYARASGVPLDGLPVAVDCGNGMAGLATPQVLRELGAEVVALEANVDGYFPARQSKPTPESLATLREFVADGSFEMGIGHDGDADRIVVVDGDGEIVHEDTVVAILAEHFVRVDDVADPVVVTTPNASARIDERVEAAGGRTERVALGYLHDGIEAVRTAGGSVAFAAEPWKHVHPGFGGWIDGVASAAVLARLVADSGLPALREPVTERPYRKVNVECPDDGKESAMALVADRLPVAVDGDVDTEYGVRIDRPDGSWVLVRRSGTEPFLRVYAESESVDDLVATAVEVVEGAVADA